MTNKNNNRLAYPFTFNVASQTIKSSVKLILLDQIEAVCANLMTAEACNSKFECFLADDLACRQYNKTDD